MKTFFDKVINRRKTNSVKYDLVDPSLNPLWVADMDFSSHPGVREGILKRLEHPVLGYSIVSDKLIDEVRSWFKRRHDLGIKKELLSFTSGTVSALYAAVMSLTKEGDSVIIPTPSYPPFFSLTKASKRNILTTDLVVENNEYTFNFSEIEKLAAKAKIFILCNPHNPTGRVWREDELTRIVDICVKYDLILLSDDVHCDFVFEGKYLPVLKTSPKELKCITFYSAGKTFNITGLGLAFMHFSHESLKQTLESFLFAIHLNTINPLTVAAYEESYANGDKWTDELMSYLQGNLDMVLDYFKDSPIKILKPQGTMLMWLDCRELGLSGSALHEFFTNECKLALSPGITFGENFGGFMRLNIATQRENLKEACKKVRRT